MDVIPEYFLTHLTACSPLFLRNGSLAIPGILAVPLVIKVVASYPEEGFSQGETLRFVRILNLVIFYLPYHLVFWHKYYIQWQRSCELIMGEAAPIH